MSRAAIAMLGGTLQGGTITNDTSNGIQGFGTVTARVINNTQLLGGNGGGTLLFQTAGNDNDWDGTANTGEAYRQRGGTLELRDNATFGFTGTVDAAPAVACLPTALRSTSTRVRPSFSPAAPTNRRSRTDIGGTVTVEAGGNPESRFRTTAF